MNNNNTFTNSPTIGNEHFKAWLKKLDPVSRVRKMSAIAKTQSSAGLKGSLIKASLAQLSQRCQVMLIRLNNNEIENYSRKKPLKRPQTFDEQAKEKDLDVKAPKISKTTTVRNSQKESMKSKYKFECYNEKRIEEESTPSKPLAPNSEVCSNTISLHSGNSPINEAKIDKSKNRLKEKFRQLFGDDLDDLPLTTNNSDDLSSHRNLKSEEKPVKNYINNVYVNIYNTSPNTSNKEDDTNVNNANCTEKDILCDKSSASKKLKIDVSITGNKSKPGGKSLNVLRQGQLKYMSPKKKTKKPSNSSNRNRLNHIHKSKTSKPKYKSDSNANINLEEDSTKRLWSILGMESPTDRSERIIRSHPFLSHGNVNKESEVNSSESHDTNNPPIPQPIKSIQDSNGVNSEDVLNFIVLKQNGGKEASQLIEDSGEVQVSVPPEIETVQNGPEFENLKDRIEETPPYAHTDFRESLTNKTLVSLEAGPVCKITNTFSLARYPPAEATSLSMMTTSAGPTAVNRNKIKVQCNLNKNNDNKEQGSFEKPHVIDTITILDDDDDNNTNQNGFPTNSTEACNDSKSGHADKELSKVGTIRVKSIGILMNPEINQHINSPKDSNPNKICAEDSNINISGLNDTVDCIEINDNQVEDIEERFALTYNHYFDNFVESRIPKLGELLHLAIADLIRKEERIKRAEQLSSDDLINDEKQRAEKDFNEMMKTRGNEFSPLSESIFKKFDEKSEQTLFLSLFCRLLKHAEQIDSANRNYAAKGRDVIRCMLSKCQYKDNKVLEMLNNNFEKFQDQFKIVNMLVTKCADSHKISNNNSIYNAIHLNAPENPFSAMGIPNEITVKPISNSMSASTVILPTTVLQGKDTLNGTESPLHVSNKNPASFSISNLPNITITTTGTEKKVTNISPTEKVNVSVQPSVQRVPSTQVITLPSTMGCSSTVPSQRPTNTSSTYIQTVGNTTLSLDYCPTRVMPLTANHSKSDYDSTIPETPNNQLYVAEEKRSGIEYNKTNMLRQTVRSIKIPVINTSNSSVAGLISTPLNCAKNNNEEHWQRLQVAENSSTGGIYHTPVNSNGISINTGGEAHATSLSRKENILRELLKTQAPLPSSSHCHPFEKRMLISGKLRMMFENSSFTN